MILQKLKHTKILQAFSMQRVFRQLSSMSIEVEQKFHFDNLVVQRLLGLGAKFNREVTHRDLYYDTPNYALTCTDHWLRLRNGQWELKSPPEHKHFIGTTCQYHEHNTVEAISSVLAKIFNIPKLNGVKVQMEDYQQQCSLSPFADFTTTRKKYELNGLIVDLDETDFGYNVGEIELIADSSSVTVAHSKIQQLASSLGVQTRDYVPGKVVVFMWLHHRDQFDAMVAANVSSPMPEQLMEQVLNKLKQDTM